MVGFELELRRGDAMYCGSVLVCCDREGAISSCLRKGSFVDEGRLFVRIICICMWLLNVQAAGMHVSAHNSNIDSVIT